LTPTTITPLGETAWFHYNTMVACGFYGPVWRLANDELWQWNNALVTTFNIINEHA